MKHVSERIIMGIDPGTIIMGYGLLEVKGQEAKLLALGTINLNKFDNHYLRLRRIFDRVLGLIDEYHPDELAIEAPFFGKNVQSMIDIFGREEGKQLTERNIKIIKEIADRTQIIETGVEELVNSRKVANRIEDAREKAIAYLDKISLESLPILPAGACVLSGIIADLPLILQVDRLGKEEQPESQTIALTSCWKDPESKPKQHHSS